jgi:hypothetical protein
MEEMKMKKMLVLVTVMALSLVSMAQAADLQGDFSLASNPNGDWSYGWFDAGVFTLYNGVNSGGDGAGNTFSAHVKDGDWDTWGNVGQNLGPNPINAWASYREVGQIIYGPSISGLMNTSRWTAPTAGDYQITAVFTGQCADQASFGGTIATVSVLKNQVEEWSAGLSGFVGTLANNFTDGFGDAPSQTYNGILTLAQGDTLDFTMVTVNGNNRAMGMDIQIVPEPMTMALLGLGSLALIRRRRA